MSNSDKRIFQQSLESRLIGSKDFNSYLDNFQNISTDSIENAGKMFIYLNMCPRFMYKWALYYVDLMQNAPPSIITQTLNRIMVTGKNKEDKATLDIANRLFIKISSLFPTKFRTVDSLTKKITLNRKYNFSDTQGENIIIT